MVEEYLARDLFHKKAIYITVSEWMHTCFKKSVIVLSLFLIDEVKQIMACVTLILPSLISK